MPKLVITLSNDSKGSSPNNLQLYKLTDDEAEELYGDIMDGTDETITYTTTSSQDGSSTEHLIFRKHIVSVQIKN